VLAYFESLDYSRCLQVPKCLAWIDWQAPATYGYPLRSFALQDKAILKDVLSTPFLTGCMEAAAAGSSAATDVLLDLAAAHSRVARRLAESNALEHVPTFLAAASSSSRAAAGIVALAHGATPAKRYVVGAIPGWAATSASALTADPASQAPAAAAMAITLAALADSSDSIRRAVNDAPGCAKLAAAVATAAAVDAADAAAAAAALPRLCPTTEILRSFCVRGHGGLAAALGKQVPNRPAPLRTMLEAIEALAGLPCLEPGSPTPADIILGGGVQPACADVARRILASWRDADERAAQLHGVPPDQRTASPEAIAVGRANTLTSAQSTVSALQPLAATARPGAASDQKDTAAAHVEQVQALISACRLVMILTLHASCSGPDVINPVTTIGPALIEVLSAVRGPFCHACVNPCSLHGHVHNAERRCMTCS
jgi:hypothetical protein